MIVGLGIDLVEIDRIRRIYQRHKDRFMGRLLTDRERQYVLRFSDPAERLAGRFAAKEAAFKAIGTGVAEGVRWKDAEILRDDNGRPALQFHGKAAELASRMGANRIHVTITHSMGMAMAQVILERV